jgi:exoribonuclease R
VHVSELSGDFLRYNRNKAELSNRDTRFRVGDPIQVHVTEVDFDARRLTFGMGE